MTENRMSPPGNRDYFTWREMQERRLAADAHDRAARLAHLHMADHYARLIREEPVIAAF